jgi:glyoxylase-like metal-dependent hydrolase (beta-lactamase superfamily II)
MKPLWLIGVVAAIVSQAVLAAPVDVKFEKVSENVYAYIGQIGDRTKDNYGLNSNHGLVVTDKGAILIDSGASFTAAKQLEAAAAKVTKNPITTVINTGSQDHRWLGNGYFAGKGAQIIALQRTVETQKKLAKGQIESLTKTLGDQMKGTEAVTAANPIAADEQKVSIGGTEVLIKYFADAHFPGDVTVYVPKANVLFSGDHIFLDRMIGIHPGWSNPKTWRSAVHELMKAYPTAKVVPGHGKVADMAKAKAETGDYLDYLNDVVGKAAANMEEIDVVSAKAKDLPQFKHLGNYDALHPKNVNSTFLFYEQGN